MKREPQSWKPLIIYCVCGAIVILLRYSYLTWFSEPADISLDFLQDPIPLVADTATLGKNQTIRVLDKEKQPHDLSVNQVVNVISQNFNTSLILARHWNQESSKTVENVVALYNLIYPKTPTNTKKRNEIKHTFVSKHDTVVLQLQNGAQLEFTAQELMREYIVAVSTQKAITVLWKDCSERKTQTTAKSCKQLIKTTSDVVTRFNKFYID